MIERFYLKDYFSFDEVELDLNSGLVVFTGASGSGKSILMNSILASLGLVSCEANICESQVTWQIDSNENGIENDDINVFKHIKKEKSRYFINNQSLSKKAMNKVSSSYLRHLSLKDYSDFENPNLLSIIDLRIQGQNKSYKDTKKEYENSYLKYKKIKEELLKIKEKEKNILELKEFTAFEIEKIEKISPKIGEDEELLEIKKELSKKEKVLEKISAVNEIFDVEYRVNDFLNLADIDSSFFDDAMNELRAILDNESQKYTALDDVDIEDVLNRVEELSDLKRRYGSIEEALEYKEKKVQELTEYENIEIQKDELVKEYETLEKKVQDLASKITTLRTKELSRFTCGLNECLSELYLENANVEINEIEHNVFGKDEVVLQLNGVELNKISTGEFNRLRLAVLVLKSEFMDKNNGVLMLDEIDANLSGEESMSVAKVLNQLSKNFQIFVISHQPQLTSMGHQHFLVSKDGNISSAKELDFESRVDEIARIISGDKVTQEAKKFAKELLEDNKLGK